MTKTPSPQLDSRDRKLDVAREVEVRKYCTTLVEGSVRVLVQQGVGMTQKHYNQYLIPIKYRTTKAL